MDESMQQQQQQQRQPLFNPTLFAQFFDRLSDHPPRPPEGQIVFSFDPGETSGLAIFRGLELQEIYQLSTPSIAKAYPQLLRQIEAWGPDIFVVESYHVYAWKSKEHTFSTLYTPRLIGALECLAAQYDITLEMQTAQLGKGFVTDERLESWEFYVKGQRHARDAIRHGCQYLLFNYRRKV